MTNAQKRAQRAEMLYQALCPELVVQVNPDDNQLDALKDALSRPNGFVTARSGRDLFFPVK